MKMKERVRSNLLNPLPVALVGALVDGRPNFLVIGYIAPFNFGKHIFFSLYKKRFTRIGIHENMTFSVNIPDQTLLEKVDICGNKSGRNYDKSSLFEIFYGELGTAPMIVDCPLNMECRVVEMLDYDPNEGVIGEVVGSYANRDMLVEGKLDLREVKPIIWATSGDFNYYTLGNRIET